MAPTLNVKKHTPPVQPSAFASLLSGGIAGCVAKTIIAPFDRVKIHFQVQSPTLVPYAGRMGGVFEAVGMIYRQSGLTGLYRGHSAMLMRIFPYAAVNFYAYERAKGWLYQDRPTEEVAFWRRIAAGSMAGAAAVACTYPLDILRARLAFDLGTRAINEGRWSPLEGDPLKSTQPIAAVKKNTPLTGINQMMRYYVQALRLVMGRLVEEGRLQYGYSITGFYQGFPSTLAGILPYAGVSYFVFESSKLLYRRYISDRERIPVTAKLAMGMLAGALAQTAAYPFDVVRRRAQLCQVASHLPATLYGNHDILHVLRTILRTEGWAGLYVGLSINYIKVAPATAISFVTYEFLKDRFFHQ